MGKYFYNGQAIIASSKKEAIAFIVSSKKKTSIVASASKDDVDWICKTLAGVLDVYNIDADTEKKIFEKAADEISDVLFKYFGWNDDKSALVVTAPYNPTKVPLTCVSFDGFRDKIRSRAFEEVAEIYAKAAKEIVSIICNTVTSFGIDEKNAERLDLYINDDVFERLSDNVNTDYNFERYLNIGVRRLMIVPLEIAPVMLSVFGTQDLAKIAKMIVEKKLPKVTYDALVTALHIESKNIDLDSFEKVLLCFKKVLSSLYISINDKYTIKEILSTTDSKDPHAIDEFLISNSIVYLINEGSFVMNKPIQLQSEIRIKPSNVTAFR